MNAGKTLLGVNTIRLGASGQVVEVIKWTRWNAGREAIIIRRFETEFQSNLGDASGCDNNIFGSIDKVTKPLAPPEQRDYMELFALTNPTKHDQFRLGFHSFEIVPWDAP